MEALPDIPPTDPPDFVPEREPDVLATPEGDNEFAPDQPLDRGAVPPIERPRGNEPHFHSSAPQGLDLRTDLRQSLLGHCSALIELERVDTSARQHTGKGAAKAGCAFHNSVPCLR